MNKYNLILVSTVAITVIAIAIISFQLSGEEKAIGWDEPLEEGEESLFAEIDENGVVKRVIVADAEVINSRVFGHPSNWVRTYANNRKRGKYAGIKNIYKEDIDMFITSTETSN